MRSTTLAARKPSIARQVLRHLVATLGAVGLTLLFFMALPLIQAMTSEPRADLELRTVDTGLLPPPPPPPPEEEPEQEPEPEEPPPELMEETPLLDLSQLELAFEPGLGEGAFGGGLAMDLGQILKDSQVNEELFSTANMAQDPRPIYQPGPALNGKLLSKGPGTVTVIFIVSPKGQVQNPKVKSSSNPIFERPALAAIKQWKFEPGRRDGQAVAWHLSQRIQFPSKD